LVYGSSLAVGAQWDSLLVSLQKRFSSNYEARVSYTWSHSRGNTSGVWRAASPTVAVPHMP